MADAAEAQGSTLLTGAEVRAIRRDGMQVRAVVATDGDGRDRSIEGRFFLVSAPLTDVVEMMQPPPPDNVLAACRALRYRDHIAVNLLIEGRPFWDNWIYVHDDGVAMARIANYRNFSPDMAAGPDISPVTVEYFSFGGDALSRASDRALIERAKRELAQVGIVAPGQTRDGFVVRSPKAYPVHEIGCEIHVATIRAWIGGFENLLPIGRCGIFKYNNQDHAMATGMLAARVALGMQRGFDPWSVNIDGEYQEAAATH
jgi:protoporphyrinogen oxidase